MTKKYIFILSSSIGVSFLSGFIFGRLLKKDKKQQIKNAGNLRIDNSCEEEPPMIFLELTCNPDELFNSKEIKLNVVNKNYI